MTGTTDSRERATFDSASYLASLMAELDRAAISLRIRLARKQAGFRNRDEIAELLHVHRRSIEDWENPKHPNVPWDRLDEIAGACGVTRDWLLHGEREGEEDVLASIASRLESLEGQVRDSVALTRRALVLLGEPQADAAPRAPEQANG